jgi:hypothetical protein
MSKQPKESKERDKRLREFIKAQPKETQEKLRRAVREHGLFDRVDEDDDEEASPGREP